MGKYTDQREKYFDIVIAKYSEGMTAREIAKTIPVSKSTIYRWVEEHFGLEEKTVPSNMVIPRTPASVAKTINAMAHRISDLEKQVDSLKNSRRSHIGENLQESLIKYEAVVKSIISILKHSELI